MTEKILKAKYGSLDKPLQIGDIAIPCYVLEDGKRVIARNGMFTALDISQGRHPKRKAEGDRLALFVTGEIIKPFVPQHVIEATQSPIKFKAPNGVASYGYEAIILADICEAVLAAREAGVLQMWQQGHIARRCEILVRGFARVGIIALVDEVTGYQKERDRNELQKILEQYIAKELLPWVKTFPDEYYEELFRLRGWQYNPLSVKRPQVVGKLTNKIVYKKLPPGVIEELQKLNPVTESGHRQNKHHQLLTEDLGKKHLEKHLTAIITLMKVSPNWRIFEKNLERVFPTQLEKQLELWEDESDELEDQEDWEDQED